MRLLAPEWLLFIPVLILIGWQWKWLQLTKPLRIASLLLLLLVFSQPEIKMRGIGLDLWVLVDQSASTEEGRRSLGEWEALLKKKMTSNDRLFYIDYADTAVLRGEGDPVYSGNRDATKTAMAIKFCLARMNEERSSRIFVFSDGYSTESLKGLSERLIREEVSLDYRLFIRPVLEDYRLAPLKAANRVQFGERFLIETEVFGEPDREISYVVWRGEQEIGKSSVRLQNGKGVIKLTDRPLKSGSHRYRIKIFPEQKFDAFFANNEATTWVEVGGGPRIINITGYADDPLTSVLRYQGFEVEEFHGDQLKQLDDGRLSGVKAVILNNVPAHLLNSKFLKALDFYVRYQGGGLLMVGGKNSFGSGGYFQSPVADLLPVSMELRVEHRKLAVALAIVMDRSGSMGAGVPKYPGTTKMDLANEGAARSIELLGGMDAVTVFAVDSKAHKILPLSRVSGDRKKLIRTVRSISSGGGGIFVYTGLKEAWNELKKSTAGQRHLILFTDAADSEEPGEYKTLLKEMTENGAQVSVIGLGTDKDSDAEFIKDVAARGGGRIFFNTDPIEVPALFAMETAAVARSAFIKEPVAIQKTAGWMEIAAQSLDWLEEVDGYNLNYLQQGATAPLFTQDEYKAPLVSFWRRGAGRTAAVSFPLGGKYSQRVRSWNQYGDFIQTLARWLVGDKLPSGLTLKNRFEGETMISDLYYDENWNQAVTLNAPRLFLANDQNKTVSELKWNRQRPGHYQLVYQLKGEEKMRGALQVGEQAFGFGPFVIGVNKEWAFDSQQIRELKALALQSGGKERIQLDSIWEAPRRASFYQLWPWLLCLFLIVFLCEAWETRRGGWK